MNLQQRKTELQQRKAELEAENQRLIASIQAAQEKRNQILLEIVGLDARLDEHEYIIGQVTP